MKTVYCDRDDNLEIKLEELLVKKCIAGDKDSFNRLIKAYRKQLYSFLLRICGNRDLADDLFQEVLIRVWNGFKNYKEQQKFASWLFTIANNVTIDHHRKKKHINMSLFEVEIKSDEDLSDRIEKKEASKIIFSLVNNLSEKQKIVFLLRQHSNMSFKEISEITKEPLNTVLSHMNYAVKRIRKILKENHELTR